MYSKSLFIFRRDLRLDDNTALMAALENSNKVIPIFIFDPRQCMKNTYKSEAATQFMLESLEDLQHQLADKKAKLFLFYGEAEKIVEKIIRHQKIEAIYFNRDYTPFSRQRDAAITQICKKNSINCHSLDDALLNPPEFVIKPDGTPYQIFTHFYRAALAYPIAKPKKNNYKNYAISPVKFSQSKEIFQKILPRRSISVAIKGGRQACLARLKQLKNLKYSADHNYPSREGSSRLSPHLKFTTCSVREIYYALQQQLTTPTDIIRELYWRDFFTMIAYHFPRVFSGAFREKYNSLLWDNKEAYFKAWCAGKTGFPIVDAGMRELNETGYMHNRARLITASFLVKHLHIDWRWGEKYFAQKLIDYDPAVNNGNWQWVAGTGTDAQPYFRIFNPWLQQRKFDSACLYIKRWVKELAAIDSKIIHQWHKAKYQALVKNYPPPMIDHAVEAAKSQKLYRAVNKAK